MIFTTPYIITNLPNRKEYIEKYGKTMCAGLAFKQAKKVYIRTTLAEAHKHAAMGWEVNELVQCFDDWVKTLKLGKYKEQFMEMLEADDIKCA